jgi:hypothetical protein
MVVQDRGENCGHDQRHLAFAFEESHQSADEQQHDVNPQNLEIKTIQLRRLPQLPDTSKLRISPGSQVTVTSNGRQHTSQSVVNRWSGTLVSMATSEGCPQNGHRIDSQISTGRIYRRRMKAQ